MKPCSHEIEPADEIALAASPRRGRRFLRERAVLDGEAENAGHRAFRTRRRRIRWRC